MISNSIPRFDSIRFSVGLESWSAMRDARQIADLLQATDGHGFRFEVSWVIPEPSGRWVHLGIVARPVPMVRGAVPISTVRDVHERLIGLLASLGYERLGSNVLLSVEIRKRYLTLFWPTHPGRSYSPEEIAPFDEDNEVRDAIERARSYQKEANTINGKFALATLTAERSMGMIRTASIGDMAPSLLARVASWGRAAEELREIGFVAEGHVDQAEASASEATGYEQEALEELESLRGVARLRIDRGILAVAESLSGDARRAASAARSAHDSATLASRRAADLTTTCVQNAGKAREALLGLVRQEIGRPFRELQGAGRASSDLVERIGTIEQQLENLSGIIGNAERNREQRQSEYNRIATEVAGIATAIRLGTAEIQLHVSEARLIHDDGGSDQVTLGTALLRWIGNHTDVGPDETTVREIAQVRQLGDMEVDRAAQYASAAAEHASEAARTLDRLTEEIAKAEWILPPRTSVQSDVAERRDTLMDTIRWFLNERGQGTWTQMRNTIDMVLEAEQEPAFRADQIARRLRILGFVEPDFQRNRWSVTTPVLSPLNARSGDREHAYALFGQVEPRVLERLGEVAEVQWLPQPEHDGPRTIVVSIQPGIDLRDVVGPYGVEVADAAARLTAALPLIKTYTRSLISVDDAYNFDLVQSALRRLGRVWVPASVNDAAPGFWKLTFGGRSGSETHELFRDPITRSWFRGEREVMFARLGLDAPARVRSVQFVHRNESGAPALRVRREWRWPDLYERAAILSSGLLPCVRGQVLEYENVPFHIAKRLCEKMMVELTIGA